MDPYQKFELKKVMKNLVINPSLVRWANFVAINFPFKGCECLINRQIAV